MLNYPGNGLGRDGSFGSGVSKLRGGRAVAAEDETQEDEDEWRERLAGECRRDGDDANSAQFWNHPGMDRMMGEARGGPGPLGSPGLAARDMDAENKRLRMKNVLRTAFFLVPLVCATLLVLLCAFLIPCQRGAQGIAPEWERALGEAGGKYTPVSGSPMGPHHHHHHHREFPRMCSRRVLNLVRC